MTRLDEIKEYFKEYGDVRTTDIVWLFMKIKVLEKALEEYGDAINISNHFFNLFLDGVTSEEALKSISKSVLTEIETLTESAEERLKEGSV